MGDLKFNRKIIFKGKELKAEELAGQISSEDRKLIMLNGSRQYYFTKSIRIPGVDHKVLIVILWGKKKDKAAKKILVCNRVHWEVSRIQKVSRSRRRVPECIHRDGKQPLVMCACQLMIVLVQPRHMSLVFQSPIVLMRHQRHGRACEWSRYRQRPIVQSCMSLLRQTLSDPISCAIERIADAGWNLERIKFHMSLP